MKETTHQYALAVLKERRAEVAGEITQLESQLRHLRDSLVHLDGTLRLFAPDYDPKSAKAKRPYKHVKLFGQGKLNRLVLDALRKAGRPMTTAEIRRRCAELGCGPEAAQGMRNRVRSNLLYLAKARGSVVKEGERETAVWRLRGDA
jgi:hypothetical protein